MIRYQTDTNTKRIVDTKSEKQVVLQWVQFMRAGQLPWKELMGYNERQRRAI